MSVSASSAGSTGALPQPSSRSSISAAAATGKHQLKIDGYSLTTAVPRGAHIKSSNFQAAGFSWYINYFPNGCGRLLKRGRGHVSLQLVLDGAAPAAAVKAQFTVHPHPAQPHRPTGGGHRAQEPRAQARRRVVVLQVRQEGDPAGPVPGAPQGRQLHAPVRGRRPRQVPALQAVKTAPFVEVPPPDLHRHLGDLLVSGEASDVTLRAGGERFSVHRCVLAARSPVFKAELLGSMREGTSDCDIDIEDMEPRVFKALLQFMYTDALPEVDKKEEAAMTQHLLEAADRFNLQRLKVLCEDMLCGCIDTGSVVNTLVLADQHNCQGLKEKCFEFLKSTGLNAVMATDGFNHLASSCPTVLEELMSKLTLH
ncbi:unnamed protein product [Urochloa decumbens]|uniref:BTB domain-containing protein n=1 Tax=Urochloa decumbens TaxID=240449 RepID=A0ABC8WXT3_9POAL